MTEYIFAPTLASRWRIWTDEIPEWAAIPPSLPHRRLELPSGKRLFTRNSVVVEIYVRVAGGPRYALLGAEVLEQGLPSLTISVPTACVRDQDPMVDVVPVADAEVGGNEEYAWGIAVGIRRHTDLPGGMLNFSGMVQSAAGSSQLLFSEAAYLVLHLLTAVHLPSSDAEAEVLRRRSQSPPMLH